MISMDAEPAIQHSDYDPAMLILHFDSVNLFCALNYDGMLLELSEDINNDETPPDQSSAKQSTILRQAFSEISISQAVLADDILLRCWRQDLINFFLNKIAFNASNDSRQSQLRGEPLLLLAVQATKYI